MRKIRFNLNGKENTEDLLIDYDKLFVIGYAGRDTDLIMKHVKELEEQLGLAPPKKVPAIFRCSDSLVTQDEEIQVVGKMTCGEVEIVIILHKGRKLLGIGSDHTDRNIETVSVHKSKQVCPKPIGFDVWDYEDIKDQWDEIRLLSYQTVDGREHPYQAGKLSDILPLEMTLSELDERIGDIDDCIIYSGTVPLISEFKYGDSFRCEMIDDVLGRKLQLEYRVNQMSEEEK